MTEPTTRFGAAVYVARGNVARLAFAAVALIVAVAAVYSAAAALIAGAAGHAAAAALAALLAAVIVTRIAARLFGIYRAVCRATFYPSEG